MKKRIIATLLSLCLMVGMLPVTAMAAYGENTALIVYAGEEFSVELGGTDTKDVTVSGYMDPKDWYVMDGLVMMYDGIYNAGMNQSNQEATSWIDLTGNVTASNITTTWANGTTVGNTALTLGTLGVGVKKTYENGFTMETAFTQNERMPQKILNVTRWVDTKDQSKGTKVADEAPQYVSVFNSLFGSSIMSFRPDNSPVLFYYGKGTGGAAQNWVASLGKQWGYVSANEFLQYAMSANKDDLRKLYAEGAFVSEKDYDAQDPYAVSATSLQLPVWGQYQDNADFTSGTPTKKNYEHVVHLIRMYDRQLSDEEMAQNAAVDKARYEDNTYVAPGTVQANGGDAVTLTEYDFAAKATQTTLSAVDLSNPLKLTLNKEGTYTLNFDADGSTTTKTVTVISRERADAADAAKAKIEALPESTNITGSNLQTVSAAQAAYGALDEVQKARVGSVLAEKLAACITALDAALVEENYQVSVTFDLNDGNSLQKGGWQGSETGTGHRVQYKSGDFTQPVPTRPLYTFLGWWDGDTQVTDGTGAAQITWTNLSETKLTAHWQASYKSEPYQIVSSAQIYALARILSAAPKNDSDAILTAERKADYALFGITENYADGYSTLKTASYALADNISLSYTDDLGGTFKGIPNFSGMFDGKNHTVNVAFTLSGTWDAATYFGCLFAKLDGATVKNIHLAGTVDGTLIITKGLQDMGVLAGYTVNVNTIENITSDVTVTLSVSTEETTPCVYFGAIVGRANATDVRLINCVNRGNFDITFTGFTANGGCRLGGIIGHAYAGVSLTGCKNYGDVSTTHSDTKTIPGGLVGSGSNNVYTNCVQAGDIVSNGYTVSPFNRMGEGSTGNTLVLTVSGTAGQTIAYPGDASQTKKLGSDPVTFIIPVNYENGVVENNAFSYNEYLTVDGTRLDWFDLTSTVLTAKLDTTNAANLSTPFQSWSDAIVLNTEEDLLSLQKAINDGDNAAIDALYAKGGRNVPTDYAAARLLLQTACYKLGNDITVSGGEFTGIGTAAYPFGGRLDGQNHTVDISIATPATYIGLFGNIATVGGGKVIIRNLKLNASVDVTLTSGDYWIGTLAGGLNTENYTISNVSVNTRGISVDGTTTKTVYVGGLCGSGRLTDSADIRFTVSDPINVTATGSSCNVGGAFGSGTIRQPLTVTFTDAAALQVNSDATVRVGGLIAYDGGGTIDLRGCKLVNQTTNPLVITGNAGDQSCYVGGWVGAVNSSTSTSTAMLYVDSTTVVEGEFAVSAVSTNSLTMAGGIAAAVTVAYSVSLENYQNTIPVTSSKYAAGLVAQFSTDGAGKTLTIRNCSNSVAVTGGTHYTGGLVAYVSLANGSASITDSVNAGSITSGHANPGGLVGNLYAKEAVIENCLNTGSVTTSAANARIGGLVGLASDAATTLTIRNSANCGALTATGSNSACGGLLGKQQSATVNYADAVYLKTAAVPNATAAVSTDAAGIVAVDTEALSAGTFGTPITALSAAAPAALTVQGDAVLSGQNVTFTKVGSDISAKFLWNGTGFYTSSANVAPLDISGTAEIIGLKSEYAHTGSEITPEIGVVYNGTVLTKGTDYDVSYTNNTSVGDASITVTFRGNYTGSAVVNFSISGNSSIEVTADNYTAVYDGAAHTISVTADEDTTVTYSETKDGVYSETAPVRKDVGTTVVWYKAERDEKSVTGSAVISVSPANLTVTADNKTMYVNGALPTYTYTVSGWQGSDNSFTTEPTVTCEADGKTTGTYTIAASSANAGDNYTIRYVDGTLTVYTRSSGGSSNTSTSTSKNPDGSTTTTTTNKATGTVTVTTKLSDGTTGTVTTDKNGNITEVKATVSSTAVNTAEKTREAVTLPVEVPAAKTTEDAPAVQVTVPKSAGSIKVEVPVEKVTPGTVAVIVKADGSEEIVKTSIPTENGVTLKLDGSATVKIIDNAKDFSDTNDHWAEDAISFVTAREMFSGTSVTTFSPNAPMTRAMLMTVLARFNGVDTNSGSVWYEKGMEWAKQSGVSDGSNPNGSITREQLATMLWRYSGSPVVEGGIDSFNDADKVSSYANDAMRWAVETGLIGGIGNNTLAPQGNTTRAQLATILMRYCENIVK